MDDGAHIDFETRSSTELTKSGVYRYAEDPATAPWGFAWRIGNRGVVRQWRPGYPDPVELLDHVRAGKRVVCHNAAFERTIWNMVLRPRFAPHWPALSIAQQDCTMARAAAVAMPQKLDQLGEALHADMRKDMEGHRLMMKMARPRRFNEDGSITWWDDPEDVDRNMAYCEQDVRTETNADELLPMLTPQQRATWQFDQIINERGVRFDMDAVRKCASLVEYAKKQNDRVMRELTGRTVPKCSNDKKIIEWLNERGVDCTSLAKGEVDDVVALASWRYDDTAQKVIKLRQAAWKTSTAKYKAMDACVSSDNRIRGMLNWHGASTGRWAGRLVQPQNFPRVDPDDAYLGQKIEWLHKLLSDATHDVRDLYDHIEAVYGPLDVLDLLSKALRSMIVAADGHYFVGGDFSNVEGRVNAWLARETWKLKAFRDFDTIVGVDAKGKPKRLGEDPYVLAYAKSFNVGTETVTKAKRQVGKVQELALGFQGGIGACITMCATYGVNPYVLSKAVRDVVSDEQWGQVAYEYRQSRTNKLNLFENEWTALKILVNNWRAANAAIVASWWAYQDAAIEAVASPGHVVACVDGRVSYYSDTRALWCVLPSGRMLCYAEPELYEEEVEYVDKKTGEVRTRLKRSVSYMGVDSVTRQWRRQYLYGGMQCENIVQAASVDLLIEAMFRVEQAGYPVVLTVHDEILSEPRVGFGSESEFEQLMAVRPAWAQDLPLAVGAWTDTRYVK